MMMKLSQKRERWASGRESALLVGEGIRPNAAVEKAYQKKLAALVKRMAREYESTIAKTYKREGIALDASLASQARIAMNALGDRWAGIFLKASGDILDGFLNRANKSNKSSSESSLKALAGGLTIKVPEYGEAITETLKASKAYNVSLIKSIHSKYHEQVEGVVMRSIQSGGGGAGEIAEFIKSNKGMMESIRDYGYKTEKRADFIARDQTRKINSALGIERMKAAGVKKVRWRHSRGGAEPRELHVALNNQIFDIDSPPVINDKTGARGWGGEEPNCRCYVVPVIEFDND